MPGPQVSVIITTYNRSALLLEAVRSVLAQTYHDWELIVADDGSSDDTAQQMAAYAGRLRYLRLVHSGKAEIGRNRAIAQARGAAFAFLDDDDLWHEHKLQRQMALLEADEKVGYVYGNYVFLLAGGQRTAGLLLPGQMQAPTTFDKLLQGCFVHPSTVLMRRTTFEAAGPFDEELPGQGDYLLWLRAARAAPVACLSEPLVTVRRSPMGLSGRAQLSNVESAIQVLQTVRRQYRLTWKQRLASRRTLSRWHATVGLRHGSPSVARAALLRSIYLNPLQRPAWKALLGGARR